MRQILTFILFLGISASSFGQVCTPTWSGGNTYGIIPDTATDLPPGNVGQPYDCTVQFRVPKNDTSLGFPITIDYVELIDVDGLSAIPASVPLAYNCNPSICQFEGDSTGCVRIQGTPNTMGNYPLSISVKVHAGALAIPLTYSGYQIVVNAAIGIEGLTSTGFSISQSIPNPASSATDISFFTENNSEVRFEIKNVLGSLVYQKIINATAGANQIEFNVASFPSGIYFYSIRDKDHLCLKPMLVSRN
jgi:hypothetical protein